MRSVMKRMLRAAIDRMGYTINRKPRDAVVSSVAEFPPDFTLQEREIWRFVEKCTMTSKERVASLVRAVQYVEHFGIPGAVVECGVWRGGSMMAVAKTLLAAGSTERELFLFDTYSGMPEPGLVDVDTSGRSGRSAAELLAELRKLPVEGQNESDIVAQCALDVVRANVMSSGYAPERLHFVEGRVEETIPGCAPNQIALLRLDTDWYESTRHELIHLFPRLSSHGILIVDDYGDWQGARLAVDEYFERNGEPIFLSRIDYTGRIAVRP
jgi:O-methyltransferase